MADKADSVFRFSFWRLFAWAICYAVPVATLLYALLGRGHLKWQTLAEMLALEVLFTGLITVLFLVIYPVHLSGETLSGHSFWGRKRCPLLSDISLVKKANIGGLPYLRVFAKELPSPLWLPLFLRDMETFKKQIGQLAPEGNPLRDYFEKQ